MSVVDRIVELIRETSSSLPEDVLKAIKSALRREERGKSAAVVLKTILDNCALAKRQSTPLCQDTGTLAFYVDDSLKRKVTPAVIKRAVAIATERGYLRRNCIDSVTGKSYDDNCCSGAPVIHYTTADAASGDPAPLPKASVTLLMKGGGSENMSRQYSLPDAELGAGRDLEGVRKCILDAVVKAQGFGCAPGILGVCIGGDRATAYEVAKEQLLRPLDEAALSSSVPLASTSPTVSRASSRGLQPLLAGLERRILRDANSLGIGPMGLGGKTTLLGVKIASRPRVPASFFVTIAYMCWACRRRTITFPHREPSVPARPAPHLLASPHREPSVPARPATSP